MKKNIFSSLILTVAMAWQSHSLNAMNVSYPKQAAKGESEVPLISTPNLQSSIPLTPKFGSDTSSDTPPEATSHLKEGGITSSGEELGGNRPSFPLQIQEFWWQSAPYYLLFNTSDTDFAFTLRTLQWKSTHLIDDPTLHVEAGGWLIWKAEAILGDDCVPQRCTVYFQSRDGKFAQTIRSPSFALASDRTIQSVSNMNEGGGTGDLIVEQDQLSYRAGSSISLRLHGKSAGSLRISRSITIIDSTTSSARFSPMMQASCGSGSSGKEDVIAAANEADSLSCESSELGMSLEAPDVKTPSLVRLEGSTCDAGAPARCRSFTRGILLLPME